MEALRIDIKIFALRSSAGSGSMSDFIALFVSTFLFTLGDGSGTAVSTVGSGCGRGSRSGRNRGKLGSSSLDITGGAEVAIDGARKGIEREGVNEGGGGMAGMKDSIRSGGS